MRIQEKVKVYIKTGLPSNMVSVSSTIFMYPSIYFTM